MALRIALNGFGRIGRYLTRLLAGSDELQLVALNARADNRTLAHLFKYDSVFGQFQGSISCNDSGLMVNGKQILVTREPVGQWKWKDLGIDVAVETTGTIKDRGGLNKHLEAGAKQVVISAPAEGADLTVVMGVNHNLYDPAKHLIISNASCTTNCLAPAAKVLHENFGIKHGLMTTIHSYTMSQRILDGSHKDLRRARAAAVNIVPTSTGAAKALGLVIPALKGKMDGMAVRIPTPNVSMMDLTCAVDKTTSVQEVNAALKFASENSLMDYLGYSDEPLVSIDYVGSIHGGVVDAGCTMLIDGKMIKVILWYDNESGFTNQLVRLLRLINQKR